MLGTNDWHAAGLDNWTKNDDWTSLSIYGNKNLKQYRKPATSLLAGGWSKESIQPLPPEEDISTLFINYAAWEYDVDRATFVSELEDRNWTDSYVWSTDLNDPLYGVENYSLEIPEPHTIVMLLAAGTVTAMSFGKRRKDNSV
ncbi:hypothetical protein BVX94_01755 [bacterium B17]|nr:hypothetical protein BVX94_01755 [bacterium B17]